VYVAVRIKSALKLTTTNERDRKQRRCLVGWFALVMKTNSPTYILFAASLTSSHLLAWSAAVCRNIIIAGRCRLGPVVYGPSKRLVGEPQWLRAILVSPVIVVGPHI